MKLIEKLFEEELKRSIWKPKQKLQIPTITFNPRLKRVVARIVFTMKEGKVIGRPKIEVSPYFKKLPKEKQKQVLRHEIQHLIYASATGLRHHGHSTRSPFAIGLAWMGIPRYVQDEPDWEMEMKMRRIKRNLELFLKKRKTESRKILKWL